MELYVGHRPWLCDDPTLTTSLQEKQVSPLPPAMPLGLGSAFASLPPPPPLPELRLHHHDSSRYLWDAPRLLPHHPHPTAG
ncbi:hypothetical protein FHG87_000095 [Trinorchestia longiramus]|nr:hypothetical protein FHG87_000095 [Trinorchestia longiramus]